MTSKHKAGLIVRTPADQLQEIVRKTAGFVTAEAEQDREKFVNLYTERCINGVSCLEDDVAVALPGLCMAAQELALGAAFVEPNTGRLGEALAEYVVSNYLHYRALRARIWHLEKQNLFGVDLAAFGFAACAAVAFGAHHEGQWLSREYIRHVSQKYDDPYAVDTEFVQFCDWLLTWYVTGSANPEKCPSGVYSALARPMHDGPAIARAMQSVLDARTDHAYRQFVLEEDAEPRFYRQLFSASFPFELLAFKVLVERHHNVSIDLAHPATDRLQSIHLPERHALSEFAVSTERRLKRLELELGLVDSG